MDWLRHFTLHQSKTFKITNSLHMWANLFLCLPSNRPARVKILIWKWRIMVGTNQTERELSQAQCHRMKVIYIQGKIHTVGQLMGAHWQQSTFLLSYWVEQRSWYQNCPIPFRHGDLGWWLCQCTWAGMTSNQENSHNYHHSLSWHPSQWLWCHLMQLEHKWRNIFCQEGSWVGTKPKTIDWMRQAVFWGVAAGNILHCFLLTATLIFLGVFLFKKQFTQQQGQREGFLERQPQSRR